MRKFLVWKEDGERRELSPITFAEFCILAKDFWLGSDDMAWEHWKRFHKVHELSDFDGFDEYGHLEINIDYSQCPIKIEKEEVIIEIEEGDLDLKFDIDYS